MRILLIEDDHDIADVIQRGLTDQSYVVDVASNADDGEDFARNRDYQLVILDVMLPGRDGRSLCRTLRGAGIVLPVLMLTALGADDDVMGGLDDGADDYLTKPFNFSVLLARIRTLTRTDRRCPVPKLVIGDLVIDSQARTVHRAGELIALTAKEFLLLEYFAQNEGRIITREKIGRRVWDMQFDAQSNVVDSMVRFLRAKVDKAYSVPLIQTVRGAGYRLVAPESGQPV